MKPKLPKQSRSASGATSRARQTSVRAACFHPDGKRALSVGDDGILRVWDVDTGKQTDAYRGHNGRCGA